MFTLNCRCLVRYLLMTITPDIKRQLSAEQQRVWISFHTTIPTLAEDIDAWHEKAGSKAAIDYGFHMNITQLNSRNCRGNSKIGQQGISSIKVFTAYNDRLRLDDGGIFQVMRIARDAGILTMLHAENGDVIDILIREALAEGRTNPIDHALSRPAWGAVEAVLRACSLAQQAEAPLYIVHMNAAGEVDQLEYARAHGIR